MFMAMNKEIRYAFEYHEATKHSEASLATSRHYLDYGNKPMPFKIYLELPSRTLPINFPTPEANALSCISDTIAQTPHEYAKGFTATLSKKNTATSTSKLDIENLAEILFFSAGITREMKYPYGNYYMRAASATGALYPIELYVVCDDVSPNLVAGVYHFSPADFSLIQIRKGSYKNYLADAANNIDIARAPINIIFTSFAWRNAWKYQARSYRHWFWDSGVIAANLLATTRAMGLPACIIMGFLDDNVNHLLSLEEQKEAAISIGAIGSGLSDDTMASSDRQEQIHEISHALIPKFRPLSKRGEINYSEIWQLNQTSKLASKQEIEEWIRNAHNHPRLSLPETLRYSQEKGTNSDNLIITLNDLEENITNSLTLRETILRRGSSRRFARNNISLSTLKTILYTSTRAVPMDIFEDGNSLIDIYFIANGVDGLAPGGYFYNRDASAAGSPNTSLEKIKEIASSRNISGYLCLGQPLFSDASVVFFLLTDLQSVLKSLGNRGYRASQFEAGIIAGNIYLAAYAQRIGSSGSTFFDDAVTEFFSPHASNKSTMIAIGVGVPAYKAAPGKILSPRLSKEQLLTLDFR